MDDPRRKVKYNIFSRLFFCWVDPLFWTRCRQSKLDHTDLYSHPNETDSIYLLNKFNRYWNNELQRNSPKLWYALLKCIWWRILLHTMLTFLLVCVFLGQSELVGFLSEYFTIDSPSSNETRNVYLYGIGLSLLACSTVLLSILFYVGEKIGGIIRILLTSTIYQKIIRLSQVSLINLTIGRVVNIASNDVHRFDEALLYYPFFVATPFHCCVVTYLLYREIGYISFLAIGLATAYIPLQIFFVTIYSRMRSKAAIHTDKRVKVMNEVISGIRVIKMYAWEYAFRDLVSSIRKTEMLLIFKTAIIRSYTAVYSAFAIQFAMFVVFSVFVSIGGELTPRTVFSTLLHISYLRYTTIHLLVGLVQVSEAFVGYKRIKKFFLITELPTLHQAPVHSDTYNEKDTSITNGNIISLEQLTSKESSHDIIVDDVTASWSMDADKLTLKNISFTLTKMKPLLAVIGPVGAGKSTLLQCLLKELQCLEGRIEVNGSIGYASQEPWIFSASMRENILFGLPYQSVWYDTVMEACSLDKDIDNLPHGDLTLVGERGVTLSGGQKARVSLARAIYRKADIYLLDDPLSAVDAAVSRHIFDRCIRDLLSDKCVVLVTHQLQYLQQCDVVLGLKEGCVTVYGDPSEVLADENMFDLIGETPKKNDRDNSTDIFKSGRKEEVHFQHNNVVQKSSEKSDVAMDTVLPSEEERSHGRISFMTYYHYFKAGGGYIITSIFLLSIFLAEVAFVSCDWWIADWADCSVNSNLTSPTCSLSDNERITISGGLNLLLIILTIIRIITLNFIVLRASQVLHNRMFRSILRCPVLFFDVNPVGRVLNRFAKDVGFMDDMLPYKYNVFQLTLTRCITAFLVSAVANPYLLIPLFVFLIVLLFIRWYYVQTSRDVKRLEALARSPLYSHISLTLQGLSTIRSYSMQSEALKQFHKYQNQHTQAWYLYVVIKRWLSIRLDSLVALFIAITIFSSIAIAGNVNPGLIGLSLTYVLLLTDVFAFTVRLSSEVESLMVSPERVMAYGKLEPEASLETVPPSSKPPSDWPSEGRLELNDLSYRHSPEGPLVLKGITCTVKSGEKIGIVGRTGAGKSSLVESLFRLAEPCGSIKIDEVDVCNVGLHDVRSKISIIPQDPVLFGGSVRYNLDPFGYYDDDKIWKALDHVQLKSVVQALDGQLEAEVSEGGGNFSVGQRQLFCLARALLKNNKILIMDEATANVDLETDSIIQEVIRDQFSHCTVLTIAHRLDTVMDSDKIMVLQGGEILEYDEPHKLLCDSDSQLKWYVDQTGTTAAQRLMTMASDAHKETLRIRKKGMN